MLSKTNCTALPSRHWMWRGRAPGGGGADAFYFAGGETGLDRILDFLAGTDKITLNPNAFSRTATVAFVAGPAPTSSDSTFLYDGTTGIVR